MVHQNSGSFPGDTNTLVYGKDWTETPLGAMGEWPQSLRTAVHTCMMSAAPACICWGNNPVCIYNDAWKDLLGVDPSLLGYPVREVLKETAQAFEPYFEEVLTTGEDLEIADYTLSLQDDERQAFNISFSPIFDENEAENGIFITLEERKRDNSEADLQLQQTEQDYYDFFENAPIGLQWLGPEGTILKVNQTELDMLGYSREEYVGRKITEFYVKEALIEEVLQRVKEGEEVHNIEAQMIYKDGSIREVLLSLNGFRKNGEFIHARCSTRDITSSKFRKRRMDESDNRYRTLIENFPKGAVGLFDENLCYTAFGGELLSRVGIKPEDRVGNKITDVYPEEIVNLAKSYFTSTFEGKANSFDIELHDRQLYCQTLPIENSEGKIVSGMLVIQDVTKRWQAQHQLETMNETLEERVEERTQTLRSYQKQLRSLASQLNKAEEQEQQRLASELHDSVGQMLTVAKMKVVELSAQSSSDLEELKQIIDETFKYTQNLMVELTPPPALHKEDVTEVLLWTVDKMEKKGLDITIEDDGQLKPVDEEFRSILHQSVRELLQNVKRHAGTREARVEMLREKYCVKVIVEDTGKGFDMKESRSIPTEAGRFGLFNIKERMDWHGGSFDMYSEPGKGTKVVLSVPVKEKKRPEKTSSEDREILKSADQKDGDQQQKKVTVLLVDDHDMVRRGLRQLIEKQDDLIVMGEASHGQEAVELAMELSPDIIVMDVNMPVMDGIEATQKIKREIPDVRIIGLSFHESQEVIENMRDAGASAYLTKSDAFESLIMAIRAEVSDSNML